MNSYAGQQMNYVPSGSTKERYGVELMADILVPAQWGFSVVEEMRLKSGAHGLLAAMLENAIRDYQSFACLAGSRAARLHQEAADWLFSDATDWPYHAANVCQHLGVDIDRMRAGLQQWLAVEQAGQLERPTVIEIVPALDPSPLGGRLSVSTERYTFAKRCVSASRLFHAYVTDAEVGVTYHVGMFTFATVTRLQNRMNQNRDVYGPRYIAGITARIRKAEATRNTTAPVGSD